MDIEKFLSYKIHSELCDDRSIILDFPPPCAGQPHVSRSGRNMHWNTIPRLYNHYNIEDDLVEFNSIDGIANLRNTRGFINHSFEPIDYAGHQFFWNQDNWTNERMLCWPENGDRLFLLHSEQNSSDVAAIVANSTLIDVEPIHWFACGYECAEYWFKNFGIPAFDNWQRPIHHKYICMARQFNAKKQYRLHFLNMLDIKQGVYSLLDHCPESGLKPNDVVSSNTVQPNSFDNHDNDSAYIEMRYQTPINTSFLHVVMESVFHEQKQHLTEKIFKPIVLQQPFVLVGAAYNLDYLRSYGFKTFGDWWDESYDYIQDPQQRLQACADIVNSVAHMDITELYRMRVQMKSVLEHNRKLFYTTFADRCWNDLSAKIASVLEQPS